jgi:hypothetical protein
MAGTYTISMNANGTPHVYAGLAATEARQLLKHFDGHAMGQIIASMPEPDDSTALGTNIVTFSCTTTRDADGSSVGTQLNTWPNVSTAGAGALQGAFDGALAKLDKHLAAKKSK